MGRNAKQTQYGLAVSCYQGKRAINSLNSNALLGSQPTPDSSTQRSCDCTGSAC